MYSFKLSINKMKRKNIISHLNVFRITFTIWYFVGSLFFFFVDSAKWFILFVKFLKNQSVKPEEINPILEANNTAKVFQSGKLFKIAARPQLDFSDLKKIASVQEFIEKEKRLISCFLFLSSFCSQCNSH